MEDDEEGHSSYAFDHLYACNADEDNNANHRNNNEESLTQEDIIQLTSNLTSARREIDELKDLIFIHLDLIQQQNDEILQKDKDLIGLQEELEKLRASVNQSDGTVNFHVQNINPPPLIHLNPGQSTSTVAILPDNGTQMQFANISGIASGSLDNIVTNNPELGENFTCYSTVTNNEVPFASFGSLIDNTFIQCADGTFEANPNLCIQPMMQPVMQPMMQPVLHSTISTIQNYQTTNIQNITINCATDNLKQVKPSNLRPANMKQINQRQDNLRRENLKKESLKQVKKVSIGQENRDKSHRSGARIEKSKPLAICEDSIKIEERNHLPSGVDEIISRNDGIRLPVLEDKTSRGIPNVESKLGNVDSNGKFKKIFTYEKKPKKVCNKSGSISPAASDNYDKNLPVKQNNEAIIHSLKDKQKQTKNPQTQTLSEEIANVVFNDPPIDHSLYSMARRPYESPKNKLFGKPDNAVQPDEFNNAQSKKDTTSNKLPTTSSINTNVSRYQEKDTKSLTKINEAITVASNHKTLNNFSTYDGKLSQERKVFKHNGNAKPCESNAKSCNTTKYDEAKIQKSKDKNKSHFRNNSDTTNSQNSAKNSSDHSLYVTNENNSTANSNDAKLKNISKHEIVRKIPNTKPNEYNFDNSNAKPKSTPSVHDTDEEQASSGDERDATSPIIFARRKAFLHNSQKTTNMFNRKLDHGPFKPNDKDFVDSKSSYSIDKTIKKEPSVHSNDDDRPPKHKDKKKKPNNDFRSSSETIFNQNPLKHTSEHNRFVPIQNSETYENYKQNSNESNPSENNKTTVIRPMYISKSAIIVGSDGMTRNVNEYCKEVNSKHDAYGNTIEISPPTKPEVSYNGNKSAARRKFFTTPKTTNRDMFNNEESENKKQKLSDDVYSYTDSPPSNCNIFVTEPYHEPGSNTKEKEEYLVHIKDYKASLKNKSSKEKSSDLETEEINPNAPIKRSNLDEVIIEEPLEMNVEVDLYEFQSSEEYEANNQPNVGDLVYMGNTSESRKTDKTAASKRKRNFRTNKQSFIKNTETLLEPIPSTSKEVPRDTVFTASTSNSNTTRNKTKTTRKKHPSVTESKLGESTEPYSWAFSGQDYKVLSGAVRRDYHINTYGPSLGYFYMGNPLTTEQSPNEKVILEVPSWRITDENDYGDDEIVDEMDRDTSKKLHTKLEADEKRRKRWDYQMIREQRHIEKLKESQLRRSKCRQGKNQKQSGNKVEVIPFSLYPTLDDIKAIDIVNDVPLNAFGENIPDIRPRSFCLPGQKPPSRLYAKLISRAHQRSFHQKKKRESHKYVEKTEME